MARIATLKVEIPTDDAVRFDAIKAVLTEAIRKLGNQAVAQDPVEGQPALDGEALVFFSAATVKTFMNTTPRGPRKAKGA